ncbi:hypothetical protein K505DRAFT_369896 [Melanomma pulvis-pyrius CBS 109.77]|uniref:Uncharacterized protein n=1 Tax=Melanomma pulvis-pyrius CBS 109.77 TaxID=1314802 RepID=A0A6A6XWU1_9PLEO|nr:hypothetical protein K505DRAFT_369896 [Melanomma pulvis-pyrius CBS 109.77]
MPSHSTITCALKRFAVVASWAMIAPSSRALAAALAVVCLGGRAPGQLHPSSAQAPRNVSTGPGLWPDWPPSSASSTAAPLKRTRLHPRPPLLAALESHASHQPPTTFHLPPFTLHPPPSNHHSPMIDCSPAPTAAPNLPSRLPLSSPSVLAVINTGTSLASAQPALSQLQSVADINIAVCLAPFQNGKLRLARCLLDSASINLILTPPTPSVGNSIQQHGTHPATGHLTLTL